MIKISYDEMCIHRSTEKAWCVLYEPVGPPEKRRVVFLPKSQVDVDESSKTIDLPEWLVLEKGLDLYVC